MQKYAPELFRERKANLYAIEGCTWVGWRCQPMYPARVLNWGSETKIIDNQFPSTDSGWYWGRSGREMMNWTEGATVFSSGPIQRTSQQILSLSWEEFDFLIALRRGRFQRLTEIGPKYEEHMNKIATWMTHGRWERIFGWEERKSGNCLGRTNCPKINTRASKTDIGTL